MNKKILRRRYLSKFNIYDLNCSFEKIISQFNKMIRCYEEKGFTQLEMLVSPPCITKYGGDKKDMEFSIYGFRLETDEEYKDRLEWEKSEQEKEARILKKQEEKEIIQLKELMEKYPNIERGKNE